MSPNWCCSLTSGLNVDVSGLIQFAFVVFTFVVQITCLSVICSVNHPLLMCTFVLFSLVLLADSSCCFVFVYTCWRGVLSWRVRGNFVRTISCPSCCTILRLPTSALPMYSVTLFSLVLLTDSSCCFVLLVYCWLCLLFPPSTQRRAAQSFGGERTSELDIIFLFCGHLVFS